MKKNNNKMKFNPFMQEITALKPPENVGRAVSQAEVRTRLY